MSISRRGEAYPSLNVANDRDANNPRGGSSTTLSVLALSGNKISDPGLASIAAALPRCLATLNLNFNMIGGQGASALAAALPLSCLHVVYLDGNRYCERATQYICT